MLPTATWLLVYSDLYCFCSAAVFCNQAKMCALTPVNNAGLSGSSLSSARWLADVSAAIPEGRTRAADELVSSEQVRGNFWGAYFFSIAKQKMLEPIAIAKLPSKLAAT